MKWYLYYLCWLGIIISAVLVILCVIDLFLLNTGNSTILYRYVK